jgi:hypothetical protein
LVIEWCLRCFAWPSARSGDWAAFKTLAAETLLVDMADLHARDSAALKTRVGMYG